jgi:hypothetical protein
MVHINLIELAERINEENRVKAERQRDQLLMRIGSLKFKAQKLEKMQSAAQDEVDTLDSQLCAIYRELTELECQP